MEELSIPLLTISSVREYTQATGRLFGFGGAGEMLGTLENARKMTISIGM